MASSSEVHQQPKTSTQEQSQVSNQAKVPSSRFLTRSLSGGSDILLSLSLSLQRYSRRGRKLGISSGSAESVLSEMRKDWAFL
ncbi:hypothetical protein COP2_033029 [Malus domestica]